MKTSKFNKIIKALLKPFAYFILNLLDGYGWRAFLCRIFIVIVSLKLNPLNEAVRGGPAGSKLWFATWGLFFYAIGKLIFDYSKRGIELERKRQNESENKSNPRPPHEKN